MFKSIDFENYIKEILNKEEVKPEDLLSIEELELDNQILYFDLFDIAKVPNLKKLTLKNFKINNYETNIINRVKGLEELSFVGCNIISKSRLINSNIKVLRFEKTRIKNSKYYCKTVNVEKLEIDAVKKVDIRKLLRYRNLKELILNNTKVKYSTYIVKLMGLNYLNLKSSKYNLALDNLITKNIEFQK